MVLLERMLAGTGSFGKIRIIKVVEPSSRDQGKLAESTNSGRLARVMLQVSKDARLQMKRMRET